MEPVVWFGNLLLLALILAPAVCVVGVFRVGYAPVTATGGIIRMGMRHASLQRLLPRHGDPGSRTDSVL